MKAAATRALAVLLLATGVALSSGCSLPRVPGLGGYHQVTDPATGKVYYTDRLERNDRSVEFRDGTTGAWVSLPAAEVREITREEYRTRTAD